MMSRSAANAAAPGRRVLRSLAVLAVCVAVPATRTFATPPAVREQALQTRGAFTSSAMRPIAQPEAFHRGATATEAVAAGVGAKVLSAMSAGAVAAVVQALLSSVTEPIVNRVLVKRMKVKDAIAEMTPAMITSFFATTISTNLIKFPLFEAVAMFMSLLPDMSSAVKGLVVGFIFTTSTLPITNFRYRMSIQTPVKDAIKPGVLYQAYLPTVVRDMVYAIARGALTANIVQHFTGIGASDPRVLFAVVLGSCIISAPFNEIRGFLLQSSGGKKLTFSEFFKPANFVRSTSLGALNQAIALATGYYMTPIVAKYANAIHMALDSGSWQAFVAVVASLDVAVFLISKSFSRSGSASEKLMSQLERMEAEAAMKKEQILRNQEEIKQLKEQNAKMMKNKDLMQQLSDLKDEITDLPNKLKA